MGTGGGGDHQAMQTLQRQELGETATYRYLLLSTQTPATPPTPGPMKIFDLLDESSATDAFRDAVTRFVRD
ncbi:MAG TPA: hypothetical protein VM890_00895, partial [Longimicrobium sp.]|nr:hypothetical protein [Longimicrobium sp.]